MAFLQPTSTSQLWQPVPECGAVSFLPGKTFAERAAFPSLMYYCESCADKANLPPSFFRTIYACDCCGEFAVVYDNAPVPALPSNAPTFTNPGPKCSWEKARHKAHGIFKWHPKQSTKGTM